MLILGAFRLRGIGSQALFEQPMGWVFRFEGDLIHRMRLYLDYDEAIADFESGG